VVDREGLFDAWQELGIEEQRQVNRPGVFMSVLEA